MEKLKMHSMDIINDNVKKLGELFPECLTEVINDDGKLEKAIDFDKLKSLFSSAAIEGNKERYQFTWPDKSKARALANQPINATLRPCREESVNFDTTENLYIEGDNLDVLKLLRETYYGKVKMIYIDPPYNTGNDFVYEDDFSQDAETYKANSGQYDDQGNRLQKNQESNGRFHTDWLNMMYPRLKIARDFLTDDGVIFISIDENEIENLRKLCDEVFGETNIVGDIIWDKRNPKGSVAGVSYQHESIVCYCKNKGVFSTIKFTKKKEHAEEMIKKVKNLKIKYGSINENLKQEYKDFLKSKKNEYSGGELAYSLIDDLGNIYRCVSMAAPDKPETRSHRPLIHPITHRPCDVPQKGWRFIDSTMDELVKNNKIEFGADETTVPNQRYYLEENLEEPFSSIIYYGGAGDAMGLPFDNPKPTAIMMKLVNSICKGEDSIILDFFSGSATTAHAVMQLNAQDCGKRKFIMVQLPELCDGKSEAYRAGYKNICEIGKERIRRAGKKIQEEQQNKNGDLFDGNRTNLDVGFRVLKLDSSNMEDVYYHPEDLPQDALKNFISNIKQGRTDEDLLFQVMLDLGVVLSSNIEVEIIGGKKVFNVSKGYLIACFDENVDEDLIKAVAEKTPTFFVMRDSSLANDSVSVNFDQIFAKYSPETTRKVL